MARARHRVARARRRVVRAGGRTALERRRVDGASGDSVVLLAALPREAAARLAGRFGVELHAVGPGAPIPGSYWGAPEAGLVRDGLYARPDTPAHSLLHELCHYVCMTPERRARLATDADGDTDEECAVCYLQILLADELPGFGRGRCLDDMDRWGYSFREGSARAWFDGDGRAARAWLAVRGLIDADARPTWRTRPA
jgi:hypothetical protein